MSRAHSKNSIKTRYQLRAMSSAPEARPVYSWRATEQAPEERHVAPLGLVIDSGHGSINMARLRRSVSLAGKFLRRHYNMAFALGDLCQQ
jgi:hypothetical protein